MMNQMENLKNDKKYCIIIIASLKYLADKLHKSLLAQCVTKNRGHESSMSRNSEKFDYVSLNDSAKTKKTFIVATHWNSF